MASSSSRQNQGIYRKSITVDLSCTDNGTHTNVIEESELKNNQNLQLLRLDFWEEPLKLCSELPMIMKKMLFCSYMNLLTDGFITSFKKLMLHPSACA